MSQAEGLDFKKRKKERKKRRIIPIILIIKIFKIQEFASGQTWTNSVVALIFLVPFFIDPAWSTLKADFVTAGTNCTTVHGEYLKGKMLPLNYQEVTHIQIWHNFEFRK